MRFAGLPPVYVQIYVQIYVAGPVAGPRSSCEDNNVLSGAGCRGRCLGLESDAAMESHPGNRPKLITAERQ